jgi:hypothetical protein
MSLQCYCKAVPSSQKVNFPFHSTKYVNTALKDQEKSSPQISLMASSQTTSRFFVWQLKHSTYQTKKPSLTARAQ